MLPKPKIVITGANGQLGGAFKAIANNYPFFEFIFLDKTDLPIHESGAVQSYFLKTHPAYCVNCAAYTNVDGAEKEKELAFQINASAVGNLAAVCKQTNSKLVHISTDYVFDGKSKMPYKEDSATNPLSVYGASKLEGEKLALQNNPESLILRTSWLYSTSGKNFVKTILKLLNEKKEISVVNDQIGAPTYANDLAEVIMQIIIQTQVEAQKWQPGIYNFSNEGIISWFDFATAIKQYSELNCAINSVTSGEFITPAKRPSYSVLHKEKIMAAFGIRLKDWKESLNHCLTKMQEK